MLKEVVKPNVDTEARWVKKMGKLHFGYKRHTVTDENGLVLAEETTAVNESGKIRWTFKSTCAAYYGIHCLQLIPNTRDYCVEFYQIRGKYTDKRLLSTQKSNLQRHLLVKNIGLYDKSVLILETFCFM